MRFQNECEKCMTSNQLNVVIVEKSPKIEKAEVPTMAVIPDEMIYLKKVYYHGIYVVIQSHNENGVDRKDD